VSGRYSNQEASVHAFDQMVADRYAGQPFSSLRTVRESYGEAVPKEAPIGRLDAGVRAGDGAAGAAVVAGAAGPAPEHDAAAHDPHEHDHVTTGRGSHEHAAARTTARAKATKPTKATTSH
jgi:hypothetical protein